MTTGYESPLRCARLTGRACRSLVRGMEDVRTSSTVRQHHIGAISFGLGVIGLGVGWLVLALLAGGDLAPGKPMPFRAMDWAETADNLPEVLAATLGIVLTVVAIVVQLASQRYSAHVTTLFVRDPVNISVFMFMAASCVYLVLLPGLIDGDGPPVPESLAIALALSNFGLLLPYFAYVFRSLRPEVLVNGLERSAVRAFLRGPARRDRIVAAQRQLDDTVGRLADSCIVALREADRGHALSVIDSLEHTLTTWLRNRHELDRAWLRMPPGTLPQLTREFRADIDQRGIWFETRVLGELDYIMRRAATEMPEVVSRLGTAARHSAQAALEADNDEALRINLRFINSFVRHGINARNVRVAFAILEDYRRLAEYLLEHRPSEVADIAHQLVYYGRLASDRALGFVSVTVAHDLRILCERALDVRPEAAPGIIDALVALDEEPDAHGPASAEPTLLGIRRAQAMLAASLATRGYDDLAQRIADDMAAEPPSRLKAIRDGVLAVRERTFWEVNDRGYNLDYLDPAFHEAFLHFFETLITRANRRRASLTTSTHAVVTVPGRT